MVTGGGAVWRWALERLLHTNGYRLLLWVEKSEWRPVQNTFHKQSLILTCIKFIFVFTIRTFLKSAFIKTWAPFRCPKNVCPLSRLGPSHCSIWSNPAGSAGDRPSQPPRVTPMGSTLAQRPRATPIVTKSTVLLPPSRPGPPRSPVLHPTTYLLLSKAPTVPLWPTTFSDTLSPPNRAPALGKWLSMAWVLQLVRRRRGELTKVACPQRPNTCRCRTTGRTVLKLLPSLSLQGNKMSWSFQANYCRHLSAGLTKKVQPKRHSCLCVHLCVRLVHKYKLYSMYQMWACVHTYV